MFVPMVISRGDTLLEKLLSNCETVYEAEGSRGLLGQILPAGRVDLNLSPLRVQPEVADDCLLLQVQVYTHPFIAKVYVCRILM